MRRPCSALCLVLAALAAPATGEGTGWRGDGSGHYPKADLPVTWDIDEGTGILWQTQVGKATYSSPLVEADVVYFADATATAVRLKAGPDGTIRPERLWENEDLEGEFFASPVLHEGILYCASNVGMLYALNAGTGKVAYQKELPIASAGSLAGARPANLYASLALVGKHLLLANDAGETLVLKPGPQYTEIAHNYLDAGSGASPVTDGRRLYLRGKKRLYAIGRK